MNSASSATLTRTCLVKTSLVLGLLAAVHSASAATQYWDPGFDPTANAGKGTGGAGTWTTGGANWTNGATDAVLTAANVAGFAGTGGAVTLTTAIGTAGNVSANGMGGLLFESNDYTIGNGTTTANLNISVQVAGDGVVVAPGVTGTVIESSTVRLAPPRTHSRARLCP